MDFQLDKAASETRTQLVELLDKSGQALIAAVDDFNGFMQSAWEPVREAVNKHNANIAQAQGFINDIHEQYDRALKDKSDRWKQSETGEMVSAWIEEWEASLDEVEVEPPDNLDTDDLNDAQQVLDDLPAEPK